MVMFNDLLTYTVLSIGIYSVTFYAGLYFDNIKNFKSPKPKKLPKISVLLPAYNEGEVIEKSIKSVLDIDYPKKEIIVIDDGSSDDTLKKAKKFEKQGVKVFTKKNEGYKAAAVNYGIKKCSADYIFILDADSIPQKNALKKMIGHFENPDVMAVVPSMKPWKPKNLLEKLQNVEYIMTSLIKKVSTFVNALNMTPGAPLVRKSFIEKYGGFDKENITEDLEFGMRIQSKNYKIAHAFDTTVYTVVPRTLKNLYRQRLRWNFGTLKNLKKYYYLFGRKYGDLGLFVMPMMLVFTGLVSIIYIYYIIRLLLELFKKVRLISLIDFNILDKKFAFDIYNILSLGTDIKTILFIVSIGLTIAIYQIARKHLKERLDIVYFVYIFFYGWILNLVTISSLWHFIRKKTPKW